MTDALATHPQAQLVPASYAEKAMASLMQLHTELMDEKERRVDLFRRLMEREQALAELKMYVKVLEEKVGQPPPTPAPMAWPRAVEHAETPKGASVASAAAPAEAPKPAAAPMMPRAVPRVPPIPPQVAVRPRPDGWKTW